MRVLIVAECVPADALGAIAGGDVTSCDDSYAGALASIRARLTDVVIVPESIGQVSSVSCLDVAQVARAHGVACVIVTEVWDDGAYGAASVGPSGDVCGAVMRAVRMRL